MMRNLVTVGLLAASCGVGSEGAAGGGSAPNLLSPSETRDQKLDGWIVGPDGSLRSRISSASIDAQLPPTSTGRVHLAVRGTSVRIGFRPLGIADRPAGHDGGQIVYKNVAAGSAELRYRVVAGAVEDVMVFNEQPRQREVRYEVDVSAVSGLRLVAGTLEYLDSGGAPRLRTVRPHLRDADEKLRAAELAVEDCDVDRDARAPWGRPTVAPGADRCTVRVSWDDADLRYPIALDPIWSSGGTLVHGRDRHTATRLPGPNDTSRVLIVGGRNELGPVAESELYDEATQSSAGVQPLNTPRYFHTATLLDLGVDNVSVLIAGGETPGTGPTSMVERYRSDGVLLAGEPDMPDQPRTQHTATMISDGSVIFLGGGTNHVLRLIPEPLPPSQWIVGPKDLPSSRFGHVAECMNGRVYVIGGSHDRYPSTEALPNVDSYDPRVGQEAWQEGPNMNSARFGHSVTRLDGTPQVLLVVGGAAKPETLEPVAGIWTYTSTALKFARSYHSAVGLLSTADSWHVLVVGGENLPAPYRSSELYDNGSRGWEELSLNLDQARFAHTATLLTGDGPPCSARPASAIAGGQPVLVAGGRRGATFPIQTELAHFGQDGNVCKENVDCVSSHCVRDDPSDEFGLCCNELCNEACESCSTATGANADGVCSPRAADAVCSQSRGPCDLEERCDGTRRDCPEDSLRATGAECTVDARTGRCSGETCIVDDDPGGAAGMAGDPGASGASGDRFGAGGSPGRPREIGPLSCGIVRVRPEAPFGSSIWMGLVALGLWSRTRARRFRRKVTGVLGVLALAGLLTQCGGTDDEDDTSDGGSAGALGGFGGTAGSGTGGKDAGAAGLNACAEIDGWLHARWTRQATTSAPPARILHGLAPIETGSVLFGGLDSEGFPLADTWVYEAGTWTVIQASMLPEARSGHVLVGAGQDALLFGGLGSALLDDLWRFGSGEWNELCASPCNMGPTPRAGHAASYDSEREVMVVFGGFDGENVLGDTWEWSEASGWKRACGAVSSDGSAGGAGGEETVDPNACGPAPRYRHAMTYDRARGEVVLFGGNDGAKDLDDVWSWDGERWSSRETTPEALGPRASAAMVFDPAHEVLLVFGGSHDSQVSDARLWGLLSPPQTSTDEWLNGPPTGPVARPYPALALGASGSGVLFGGVQALGEGDTWELEIELSTSASVCACKTACAQACPESSDACGEYCGTAPMWSDDVSCPIVDGGLPDADAGDADGGAGGAGGAGFDAGELVGVCQGLLECCVALSGAPRQACVATALANDTSTCESAIAPCSRYREGETSAAPCVEVAECCPHLEPSLYSYCLSILDSPAQCSDLLEGGYCN